MTKTVSPRHAAPPAKLSPRSGAKQRHAPSATPSHRAEPSAEPCVQPSAAQARKAANTSMTEADWREAMRLFCVEGLSDAKIGRRFNITGGTVARHRSNHGIERAAYPAPLARGPYRLPSPPVSGGERAQEEADGSGATGGGAPSLSIPPGLGRRALAGLLIDHSQSLIEAGRMGEAASYLHLSQKYLTAQRGLMGLEGAVGAETQREAEAAEMSLLPLPVLRDAQRPPGEAVGETVGEAADGGGDEAAGGAAGWRTWLFLGGRGAGKTLAGAAWLAGQAHTVERLALVGPSYADVREVMIEGPSGLRGAALGFGPGAGRGEGTGRGTRPRYEPSRRRLLWPNGAVAQVFSAEDVDGLRGPQFGAAWGDELCAWPDAAATLAMLRMGLRLGPKTGPGPRLVLTTTPRATPMLAALLKEPGLAVTRGSAVDNAAHLAPGFVEGLRALYGGTRLERQEIEGEVIEALEGAVFRRLELDRAVRLGRGRVPARFDRLVVAVDPPAGLQGSACGIVVAGMLSEARTGPLIWVLRDATVRGMTVAGWSARVAEATAWAAQLGFTMVVAEANQGGEMVRSVLRQAAEHAPVRLVHAKVGKRERAEPVALLYEQGRVAHAPGLAALEDEMLLLGSDRPRGRAARREEDASPSPDRADALVWALTALAILPGGAQPRVRAV